MREGVPAAGPPAFAITGRNRRGALYESRCLADFRSAASFGAKAHPLGLRSQLLYPRSYERVVL